MILVISIITTIITFMNFNNPSDDKISKELDEAWAVMTKTVVDGDFEGYSAIYHPDAVLVNGISKTSYPIASALAGWKKGFDDTKAGKMKANVTFKFTKRVHDETTAHDTGMFYYRTINSNGKLSNQYIHMNALFVKKAGRWLLVMEYQKSVGTKADWDAIQ